MAISRQNVANILRKIHLLEFVDYLIFLANVVRNRKSNQIFLADHPDFNPPPLHLAYDAYNHTHWQTYYDMGLRHSELIADLIKEYIIRNQIRICEWGCGPARVIRHLYKIDGFDNVELFGTDYNDETIKWCKKYVDNIRFIKNNLEPPLAFESEIFDCVYAISIFTHLSEQLHYDWIKELFRIIKPNGILIFTTHGDACASKLLPAEKQKYDSGCLVIRDQIREGKKHFLAYHPPRFIKEKLLKDYAILKHITNTTRYQLDQEIWCVKKL